MSQQELGRGNKGKQSHIGREDQKLILPASEDYLQMKDECFEITKSFQIKELVLWWKIASRRTAQVPGSGQAWPVTALSADLWVEGTESRYWLNRTF